MTATSDNRARTSSRRQRLWVGIGAGTLAAAVVACLLILCATAGANKTSATPASAGRGSSARSGAIVVPTEQGTVFVTPNGKPTMLLFMTTQGCSDCATQAQAIDRLAQQNGGKLEALGLEMDASTSRQDVDSFSQTLALHYPLAFDQGARLQRRFQADALSTVVILDGGGRPVFRGVDPSDDALQAALRRAGLT